MDSTLDQVKVCVCVSQVCGFQKRKADKSFRKQLSRSQILAWVSSGLLRFDQVDADIQSTKDIPHPRTQSLEQFCSCRAKCFWQIFLSSLLPALQKPLSHSSTSRSRSHLYTRSSAWRFQYHYLILDWHKSQCHYLLLCRIRKSLRSSKDSRIYAGWHLKFKFLAYLLSLDFLKVCQLDSHRGFENHGYSHQSYRRLVWSWEDLNDAPSRVLYRHAAPNWGRSLWILGQRGRSSYHRWLAHLMSCIYSCGSFQGHWPGWTNLWELVGFRTSE